MLQDLDILHYAANGLSSPRKSELLGQKMAIIALAVSLKQSGQVEQAHIEKNMAAFIRIARTRGDKALLATLEEFLEYFRAGSIHEAENDAPQLTLVKTDR